MSLTAFAPDAIAGHLKQFIVETLFIDMNPADIKDDAPLGTEVGVDSLGFAELLAHLEDEYGISVSDGEFVQDNFSTVGRIVALVGRKLGS
jgi:acyl carrier protein